MADERIEETRARTEELKKKAKEAGGTNQDIANAAKVPVSEINEQFGPDAGLTTEEILVPPPKIEDAFDADVVEVEREPVNFNPTQLSPLEGSIKLARITPKPKSEAYINDKSIALSLIINANTSDRDSSLLFDDSRSKVRSASSTLQLMDQHLSVYADTLVQKIKNDITERVSQNPASLKNYVGINIKLDSLKNKMKGNEGVQDLIVKAYKAPTLERRVADELSVQFWAAEIYKDHYESHNVLDTIWDGFGLLVSPMAYTFDGRDLAFKLDPTAKGDTATLTKKMIANFQIADPLVKRATFPKIFKAMVEAYDNNELMVGAMLGELWNPNFSSEVDFMETLDAVEGGTLLASAPLTLPWKMAKALRKSLSYRSRISKLGNGKAALNATKGKETQFKEALDADPTEWQSTVIGAEYADDGLAAAARELSDRVEAGIAQKFKEIADPGFLIKTDILTKSEKELAKQRQLDVMLGSKIGDATITRARVLSQTDEGYTVGYTVKTPQGKADREMNLFWTTDDKGSLVAVDEVMENTAAALWGSKVLSPDIILHKFADKIADKVTFGGNQASRMKNSLADLWKKTDDSLKSIPTINPLNLFKPGEKVFARADARRAIDELLITGDESKQVWKLEDLLAGNVQTASGKRKYSLAEAEAYYAKRAFFEEAHGLQNYIVKRGLEIQGIKEARWINPKTKIEEIQLAKVHKKGQGFTTDRSETILAPGLAGPEISMISRGSIDLAEAMKMGYVPVTYMNPIKVGGKTIKQGLVPAGNREIGSIRILPSQVLNKQPGYVPHIRKPGYNYVKDLDTGHTLGVFKTNETAQAWAKTVEAEFLSKGDKVRLHSVRDRDFNAIDAISDGADQYGGLYTGSRNRSGLFVDDEVAAEVSRLSAGQSVERMLESVSNKMALGEYRMAAVAQWKKTAKQVLRNEGAQDGDVILRNIDSPDLWQTQNLDFITDPGSRKMLEVHRDYMIDSLRIPTNQENSWSKFTMDLASKMAPGKTRDVVLSVGSKDPIQAFKAAVFDPYLGWFNIRQLWVQSNNAALAASMYPKQALSAIPEAMIQRLFLYTKEINRELLAKASKGVLEDAGNLEDLAISLEQFKRSGLRDSIQRGDMYGSNLGGFSSGTLDGYRKLAQKGRIFFEEGESMARLITWNIARKNWKATNPGKVIDDIAIREISDDTLRMNMNMQRENAAWFQKNAAIAPFTQFFQVQAKLVENSLLAIAGKGKWTRKEAAFAISGQIILYGTIGVPIVDDATEWLKELFENDPAQFNAANPNIGRAIDRGAVGVLFNALGFENNFSEPASIVAGLDNNVVMDLVVSIGAMAAGEKGSVELKAPGFGVIQRTGDALMDFYNAGLSMAMSPSFETAIDGSLDILSGTAAISSAWSNARKQLHAWKTGQLLSRNGVLIADGENLEGLSPQSVIAAAMGIPLELEAAYYEGQLWKFDRKKRILDTKKAIKKVDQQFMGDGNFEKWQAMRSYFLAEYEDEPIVRQGILDSVNLDYVNPRSGIDRQFQHWMSDYVRSGGKIGMKAFQEAYLYKDIKEQE